MNTESIILYDGVSMADLLKETHELSQDKRKKIFDIIQTLTPLIRNTTDASILAPIISNFMEVAVKNDEQLIKMMQVVQRILSVNKNDNSGELLTPEELNELLKSVDNAVDIPDLSPDVNKYLNEGNT